MKKFRTECDMGCIKIYNKGLALFFGNGVGDVTTRVDIEEIENKNKRGARGGEFLGHFTVKDKAQLSAYDCSDEPIYEFKKGRYFVELVKPAYLYIYKCDEDIHA